MILAGSDDLTCKAKPEAKHPAKSKHLASKRILAIVDARIPEQQQNAEDEHLRQASRLFRKAAHYLVSKTMLSVFHYTSSILLLLLKIYKHTHT